MLPGCLFELSSRFTGPELAAQLLAVYALRDSIASIPLSSADDTVKWAKLKWWSEELCEDVEAPERHPVLRALQHSGARQHLTDSLLLSLVAEAVGQIDAFPEADVEALIGLFAASSRADISLQAALSQITLDESLLEPMGCAVGVFTLVNMLLHDYPNKIQLLPLDWLAEFQVRPEALKAQPPAVQLLDMVKRLAGLGTAYYRVGFDVIRAGEGVKPPTHLWLRWSLEARFLARVVRNAERYFGPASQYGLSDVWFAWRHGRAA